MIVLPQKVALSMMSDLLDDSKIESAYFRLKQLIENGEAELAAHLVGKTQNDDKSVSETVEELRYSTRFDPPGLPESTTKDPAILKNWPITGITPVDFETRKVGATIEISVSVKQNGAWLEMEVDPAHVRFLRWAKTDAGKLASGDHLYVEQPIFHTMMNKTSLRVRMDNAFCWESTRCQINLIE